MRRGNVRLRLRHQCCRRCACIANVAPPWWSTDGARRTAITDEVDLRIDHLQKNDVSLSAKMSIARLAGHLGLEPVALALDGVELSWRELVDADVTIQRRGR